MEIRGIGIIDVRSMYGVGAVKDSKVIDIIIRLENWNDNTYYDRLGLDKEYEEILGIDIEKLVVPGIIPFDKTIPSNINDINFCPS